jgi:hypothetical protein
VTKTLTTPQYQGTVTPPGARINATNTMELQIPRSHPGTVSLASSNTNVFTVPATATAVNDTSTKATITAVGQGTATLTATIAGNTNYKAGSGTSAIEVMRIDDDWVFEKTELAVKPANTATVAIKYNNTGQKPTGSIASTSIATITASPASADGSFTIKGVGTDGQTTTLTATTPATSIYNARQQTCKISISGKTTGTATWDKTATSTSLKETQTYAVKLTGTHSGGVLTSANTHNPGVVSVSIASSTATITAVGVGTTTVTLYAAGTSAYTDSPALTIQVAVRPAELKLGSVTVPVYVGDKPVKRIYKGTTLIL